MTNMLRAIALLSVLGLPLTSSSVKAEEQSIEELPFTRVIPAINADGLEITAQRIQLSEQNGWLVATLATEPDELEWRIVLASLTPDTRPVIKVHPGLPLFSVQYGPWFIREGLGRLRVHREPKEFSGNQWQQIGDVPRGPRLCSAGQLFVVKQDEWFWVCSSPTYDQKSIDTLVRFQHERLSDGQQIELDHGGLLVELSAMASYRADGRLFDGNGVQPDVRISPIPVYFIGKADNVMDAAKELLLK